MSQSLPDAERTTRTVVTGYEDVVRRGRRGIGGAWWLGLAAVPLLLGLIGAGVSRSGVESELTSRAQSALQAAGIAGATVHFDGRDATVTLPAGADATKALDVVRSVDGVRVAAVAAGSASGSTGGGNAVSPSAMPSVSVTPTAPVSAAFGIAHAGNTITLTGSVPDEATHQAILAAAKASANGASIVDQITVSSGSALPTGLTASGIGAALAGAPDGTRLSFDGKSVTLTGEVASDAVKSAAASAAAAAFPGASIVNNLTVKAPAASTACASLTQTIADTLKAHPLTFANNSAELSADQTAAVSGLAASIKGCLGQPGGPTSVAAVGHTDVSGGTGVNDPLSIARAEAVKAVLVSGGVPAAAITTSGAGASQPVAPNDSSAGRAANRRVEITVK